jgi:hypothetical protein
VCIGGTLVAASQYTHAPSKVMTSSMAAKKTNVSTWLSANFQLAVLRISSPESVEIDEKAKR